MAFRCEVIGRDKAGWLRGLVFGRGLLAGPAERRFLSDLADRAWRVHPDFLARLADCGGPVFGRLESAGWVGRRSA